MSAIGAALRAHRERAGLTQAALAARCGLEQRAVSAAELVGPQSVRVLRKLCDALGVPSGSLMDPEAAARRARNRRLGQKS